MSSRDLPFSFSSLLTTDPEAVASAVSPEEGMSLTKLLLFPWRFEAEEAAPLLDRGLAEADGDSFRVTSAGMRTVSLFPLLGRKGPRHPYPEAFFPFLLSTAASGRLHGGRSQKMLSSPFFTSLFPSIDPERIGEAASIALEALIDAGVVVEKGRELGISVEESLRFMSLSEEERIAIVLDRRTLRDPALMRRLSCIAFAATRLSGADEERIRGLLDDAGVDIERLRTLSVIDIDDGLVTGRIPERISASPVISSDFTITCPGPTPRSIHLYASPESSDTISTWKITKQSMRTAFSLGMTPDDVERELTSLSSFPLPDTIIPRIEGWHSSFSSVKARRALILTADERNARIIEALPTIQMHIIERLGDGIFLMKQDTEMLWRRALENAGFDMMGPTEGPAFSEEEERPSLIPPPTFALPVIPDEREIPYDSERRSRLLASSDTPLRTALIESGFIVHEDDPTPSVEMVNGLYYQEKMRLINAGIADGMKIYAESTDGSVVIAHAEKSDDGMIAIGGKQMDCAKIWKAAALPPSVRDLELRPSDSGSR